MGFYEFNMSCGHKAKREVAEPSKYYDIDRKYYTKQGLCDDCWRKLHKKHRQEREGDYEVLRGVQTLHSKGEIPIRNERYKNEKVQKFYCMQ